MLSLTGITPDVNGTQGRSLSWPATAADNAARQVFNSSMALELGKTGRVVLGASQDQQTSIEVGSLQQGLFSYYLVMALMNPAADTNHDGWISAVEAFNDLSPRVKAYATALGTTQTPTIGGDTSTLINLTKP
jgi:uncharacterized caspase-like protein